MEWTKWRPLDDRTDGSWKEEEKDEEEEEEEDEDEEDEDEEDEDKDEGEDEDEEDEDEEEEEAVLATAFSMLQSLLKGSDEKLQLSHIYANSPPFFGKKRERKKDGKR